MQKLFLTVLIAIAVSGCATTNTGGRRRTVFMPQVGVVLTLQNNCAPFVSVESVHGVEEPRLPYGNSVTIAVPSRAFSGYSREIWVMAKAYTETLTFIGSVMFREYVSTYEGSRERLWQVDRLDSPPRARCPSSPP